MYSIFSCDGGWQSTLLAVSLRCCFDCMASSVQMSLAILRLNIRGGGGGLYRYESGSIVYRTVRLLFSSVDLTRTCEGSVVGEMCVLAVDGGKGRTCQEGVPRSAIRVEILETL